MFAFYATLIDCTLQIFLWHKSPFLGLCILGIFQRVLTPRSSMVLNTVTSNSKVPCYRFWDSSENVSLHVLPHMFTFYYLQETAYFLNSKKVSCMYFIVIATKLEHSVLGRRSLRSESLWNPHRSRSKQILPILGVLHGFMYRNNCWEKVTLLLANVL